jgi:hypothetical protein
LICALSEIQREFVEYKEHHQKRAARSAGILDINALIVCTLGHLGKHHDN